MKVEDIVWIMKDKTEIRLGDMTHTHLANTIRMVKRKIARHEREIDVCYAYSGSDHAMDAAEQSANTASREAEKGRRWLRALTGEQARRENLHTAEDAIAIMQEAA